MKINNFTVKNFEDEKQIMDDQQYQLNKEIEWEKDKAYVLTQVTEKLAVELKQVEDIAETISDRRFASRLLTKLKERNMEYHIHKDYFTSWHKTPEGGYEPGEKMSRDLALRSYTINGAYAAFEEDIKGSIEVGKLGDFTVLDKDIMSINEDEILETNVEMTIIGGKVVFSRN